MLWILVFSVESSVVLHSDDAFAPVAYLKLDKLLLWQIMLLLLFIKDSGEMLQSANFIGLWGGKLSNVANTMAKNVTKIDSKDSDKRKADCLRHTEA